MRFQSILVFYVSIIPMVFLEIGILLQRIGDGANQGHRFVSLVAFFIICCCEVSISKKKKISNILARAKRGL